MMKEFIESVITEPAEESMTLFISYAHREALICRLIVYALKARGHKVWFDELNIPHGSDWRSEILKGELRRTFHAQQGCCKARRGLPR